MASQIEDIQLKTYESVAENFIKLCQQHSHINGYSKLEKKCRAELKFLTKMHQKTTTVRKSHLRSSNLYHYAAMLYTATQCASNLVGIMQPFSISSCRLSSLTVDIVCGHGLIWLKVIARKAQALHLIWAGRGQFSERDITRQVEDYLRCAKQHPINYLIPKVHFVFFNAVTQPMADWLHQLGICVHGDVVPVCSETKQKLMSVADYFDDESDSNTDDDDDDDGSLGDGDGDGGVACDPSVYNSNTIVGSNVGGGAGDDDDDDDDDIGCNNNNNHNNISAVDNNISNDKDDDDDNDDDDDDDVGDDDDDDGGGGGDGDAGKQLVHSNSPNNPVNVGVSSSSIPKQNIQPPEMSDCASVCSEMSADGSKHLLHIEKTVQTTIDESMLHLQQLIKKGEEEEGGKEEVGTHNIRDEVNEGEEEEEEEDYKTSRQNLTSLLLIQKCIMMQMQSMHSQRRPADSAICVDADDNGNRNVNANIVTSTADPSDPGNIQLGTNTKPPPPPQPTLPFASLSSSSSSLYPSSCASSSSLYTSSSSSSSLSMAAIERGINFIGSDHIRTVNLDITTLITLVSAVTHGRCNFIFPEKILTFQAKEEREKPVLHQMLDFLKGKKLCCCETAMRDFRTILDTLGGQSERQRAEELISKVEVVPDSPSERARSLPLTNKLKERSKIIFGTGDSLKAVTMTANSAYVRAAENQGVTFAVFIHASRALTEEKEKNAKPIPEDSQQ